MSIPFNRLLSQYLALQNASLSLLDVMDLAGATGGIEVNSPEAAEALHDAVSNLERVLSDGGASLPNRVH